MTTEEAIQWGGGTQVALAKLLRIRQNSIAEWGEYPPPYRQLQIEALSRGALRSEPEAWVPQKKAAA